MNKEYHNFLINKQLNHLYSLRAAIRKDSVIRLLAIVIFGIYFNKLIYLLTGTYIYTLLLTLIVSIHTLLKFDKLLRELRTLEKDLIKLKQILNDQTNETN